MDRILCLDMGDKKIGVAVSDPLGMTAQGIATLMRQNFKKDCEAILKYVREYAASQIIIGLPIDLQNEEGVQAKKVRFFCEGLQKFFDEKKVAVAIQLLDESFSSQEAEAFLIQADVSRKKRKEVIDKLAAVMILQNYLDSQHD